MKGRLAMPLALVVALVALVLVEVRNVTVSGNLWPFVAVGMASAVVLGFAVRFERSGVHTRVIAVVALLGTLSALLRVPFAAIPNLQPSTYLVICSGYVFGPVAGFAVGALTAIVSNFFLGHGPWTLFQVLAWGLAGATAVVLRRLPLRPAWLVLSGLIWGLLFGIIMNVWTWIGFVYPLTARTFLLTWAASVSFDGIHAVGNAFFMGFLGVRTIRILERYRGRFTWMRQHEGMLPEMAPAPPLERLVELGQRGGEGLRQDQM